ncbi:hypothetical protein BDZ90DRAFT_227091 [Jaminaea rosea]|uniref:Uncharacterized protein n=1 Tax=Jaminaea rosea TaxID=1569628 RepID=A0A316URB8_9BASI|nr:hypothetical protein BDZ90DRAFT_227091 [Jaminaea rosea]PWN27842.1 hypothetical protein BDZ90DRAFT_227091 [Jaminaea rosea]
MPQCIDEAAYRERRQGKGTVARSLKPALEAGPPRASRAAWHYQLRPAWLDQGTSGHVGYLSEDKEGLQGQDKAYIKRRRQVPLMKRNATSSSSSYSGRKRGATSSSSSGSKRDATCSSSSSSSFSSSPSASGRKGVATSSSSSSSSAAASSSKKPQAASSSKRSRPGSAKSASKGEGEGDAEQGDGTSSAALGDGDEIRLLSDVGVDPRAFLQLVREREEAWRSKPAADAEPDFVDNDGTEWFETPIVTTKATFLKDRESRKMYTLLARPEPKTGQPGTSLEKGFRLLRKIAGEQVDLKCQIPPTLNRGIGALETAIKRGDTASSDLSAVPRCVVYAEMVLDANSWAAVYLGKSFFWARRGGHHRAQVVKAEAVGARFFPLHYQYAAGKEVLCFDWARINDRVPLKEQDLLLSVLEPLLAANVGACQRLPGILKARANVALPSLHNVTGLNGNMAIDGPRYPGNAKLTDRTGLDDYREVVGMTKLALATSTLANAVADTATSNVAAARQRAADATAFLAYARAMQEAMMSSLYFAGMPQEWKRESVFKALNIVVLAGRMEALFPGEASGTASARVRYIDASDDPSELIVASWWEEAPIRRGMVVEICRADGKVKGTDKYPLKMHSGQIPLSAPYERVSDQLFSWRSDADKAERLEQKRAIEADIEACKAACPDFSNLKPRLQRLVAGRWLMRDLRQLLVEEEDGKRRVVKIGTNKGRKAEQERMRALLGHHKVARGSQERHPTVLAPLPEEAHLGFELMASNGAWRMFTHKFVPQISNDVKKQGLAPRPYPYPAGVTVNPWTVRRSGHSWTIVPDKKTTVSLPTALMEALFGEGPWVAGELKADFVTNISPPSCWSAEKFKTWIRRPAVTGDNIVPASPWYQYKWHKAAVRVAQYDCLNALRQDWSKGRKPFPKVALPTGALQF